MPLDQIDVVEQEQQLAQAGEMSFLDHLEELRWRVIRALGAVVGVGILFFLFNQTLFDIVVMGPAQAEFITYQWICQASETLCFTPPEISMQAIGFGEAFIMSIKVSFILGFVVAFPYVFYQFWRFVKPGLYEKEQRVTRGVVIICSLLFMLGVSFGYFVIAPFATNFLMGYTLPGVENIPTLSSYLGYMIMFTVPAGAIFELPIVVYFLSKLGVVTPEFMRKYRRHSFVIILLLAAMITPPDVFTQFLIGIPLYFLYEISILISARVNKLEEEKLK
ncbi:MAG: twin-arginine translocase subunit TatC [Bacteroidota bacterium]